MQDPHSSKGHIPAATNNLPEKTVDQLESDPCSVDHKLSIYREEVEGVPGAFMVHNLLTPEECAEYIAFSEAKGYTDATHPDYQSQKIDQLELRNRSNRRCVWIAPRPHVLRIWRRIKEFVPTSLYEETWLLCTGEHLEEGEGAGVNEIFRFYRYDKDQIFQMHKDSTWFRSSKKRS
jgi:hypothetical protein